MAIPWEQVEAAALALSMDERARLARSLIASLDEEFEDPAAVERAWEAEILRRLEDHRAGKTRAIPASDVFEEARRRIQ